MRLQLRNVVFSNMERNNCCGEEGGGVLGYEIHLMRKCLFRVQIPLLFLVTKTDIPSSFLFFIFILLHHHFPRTSQATPQQVNSHTSYTRNKITHTK